MSVINNAHPGSHIPSLIFIDRLLNRKITKSLSFISIESIIEKNAPSSLFVDEKKDEEGYFKTKDNPKKKLPETLKFWADQNLWDISDEGIKACSVFSNDSNLANRIVRSIFSQKYNIHTGSSIEPLIRGICLFLALDKCTFGAQNFFKPTDIPSISASYMPGRAEDDTRLTINDSERLVFAEYGLLLGYMERVSKDKYTVDPTRLIKPFLAEIFTGTKGDRISISRFIEQLNVNLPIFDGGEYRLEIEGMMQSKKSDWKPNPSHTLSKSLSHALYRLNLEGNIYLDRLSDSIDAVTLQLPNGESRMVSHIRVVGDK